MRETIVPRSYIFHKLLLPHKPKGQNVPQIQARGFFFFQIFCTKCKQNNFQVFLLTKVQANTWKMHFWSPQKFGVRWNLLFAFAINFFIKFSSPTQNLRHLTLPFCLSNPKTNFFCQLFGTFWIPSFHSQNFGRNLAASLRGSPLIGILFWV